MAQKTNLNVSPYFDDFDPTKEYYKVLFSPGRPIQARELNNIQSQIQYQIEKFGSHIFKDGSMVIPGGVTYDFRYYAVKINPLQFGIDVNIYINNFIGKKIIGRNSRISATIDYIALPTENPEIDYITLYVKYIDSGSDNTISQFPDLESFYCDEDVIYGNTTITSGTTFATSISNDSTSTGSAAHVNRGIYFIRGYFVEVEKQTIILDYYDNKPSYKIGFTVNENIVTAKEDNDLYDNAKGFTNYAAPGADRFSISLTLDKRSLDDSGDPNFIEILRTDDGEIKKEETTTQYSIIRDYLAKRTYDESGDYSVNPFNIQVKESLNNGIGNDGVFFADELTDEGNTPSEDVGCIVVSPGTAYVGGYDIDKTTTTVLDFTKPRSVETRDGVSLTFRMGNYLRVNNVYGAPLLRDTIELYNQRSSSNSATGLKIGDARVYSFSLTDSQYSNNSTSWDLYLYDIQTYTEITLNETTNISIGDYIRGNSSSASGYSANNYSSNVIYIRQTSGSFTEGEKIYINGTDSISRTIKSVRVYSVSDVKSVYRASGGGLDVQFSADTLLEKSLLPGFSSLDEVFLTETGVVTSPNKFFTGIKTDTVVSYIGDGDNIHYNRVSSVSSTGQSMQLSAVPTVVGVATGDIGVSSRTKLKLSLRTPFIKSYNNGDLYAPLPTTYTSSLNLQGSQLTFKAQTILNSTVSSNQLVLNSSNFNLPVGLSTASFEGFDQERYSIHWNNGTIESVDSDQFIRSTNSNEITFNNIQNGTTDTVFATLVKSGIKSKSKFYNKSNLIEIGYSKYEISGTNEESSNGDGLEYNSIYGIRVQDEEICLNYPDVINIVAILESLDQDYPQLDSLTFSSIANVSQNSIIGENIIGRTSGSVARLVRISQGNSNRLDIIYLNSNKFIAGETVLFEQSLITTQIQTISDGKYKNITSKYLLDPSQKGQYYDYSRLVRKSGESEPTRKVIVIFDHYTVPSDDNGDVFTVLSYSKEQYGRLLPKIGKQNYSASDVLDFRPRVSPITNTSSLTTSPFDFSARNFGSEPNIILAPDEVCILGVEYYTSRIDRLYLDRTGKFVLVQGTSSLEPKPPENLSDSMLLATLYYQPYLENAKSAMITLESNRRYTMKDIGILDNRIDSLERLTSLSLLELNTKTFEIKDADGFDRFKTGFFVDNFESSQFVDKNLSSVLIDSSNKQMTPFKIENTLPNVPLVSNNLRSDSLSNSSYYVSDSGSNNSVRFSGADISDLKSLTLDYTHTDWIEQPYATRVENVNPFHVIEYKGSVTLNPPVDSWVRTIKLPDKTFVSTSIVNLEPKITNTSLIIDGGTIRQLLAGPFFDHRFGAGSPNGTRVTTTSLSAGITKTVSDDVVEISNVSRTVYSDVSRVLRVYDETYMRSRNVEFTVNNLKPLTRFYQFLDSRRGVDYISKIIEISSISGTFTIGETVFAYSSGSRIASFRIAAPNHKVGPINVGNILNRYTACPYDRDFILPNNYSSDSKYLNIDVKSLSNEADGEYYGYLPISSNSGVVRLVGQTSGAIATLVRNELISDANGYLNGSFFLKNPNSVPEPPIRFPVGTITYKITSSERNEEPLPGNTDISYADSSYTATGTVEERRNESLVNQTIARQRQTVRTTTRTRTTTILERFDPLAQSFEVGRTSQAPSNSNVDPISDRQGVYLTAVDIYFKKVDSGNSPVTIQIRTMELGTPTLVQLGESVTISPNDILPNGRRLKDNVSDDASVATTVVFPYPIYLAPDDEYALVLLAPESVGYEVFVAEMGENSLNSQTLTGLSAADAAKYTKQFAIGSLFKSQNGSIWTPDQKQDLKFKLYKARFNTSGTVFFTNPVINSNTISSYLNNSLENSIEVYPRKLSIGITTTSSSDSVFNSIVPGRKVTESGDNQGYFYGFVEGFGGPVASTPVITFGGKNYSGTSNNVETYNITGNGSGLVINITGVTDGEISTVSIAQSGTGYRVGDVIGIVTSTTSSLSGYGAVLTVSSVTEYDKLFLTNVQADNFTVGETIKYYNSGVINTTLTINSSTLTGGIYSGTIAKINQFNHGMYSTANKISIANLKGNLAPQKLAEDLRFNSTQISVDNVGIFETFEGIPVSTNNPGYVIIGDEIIKYVSVNTGSKLLTGIERGIDSTIASIYSAQMNVYKYELCGISLRRINTDLEVADIDESTDSYFIEINTGSTTGVDRSTSSTIDSNPVPLLSFNSQNIVGDSETAITQNLIYSEITPLFELYGPGRGISATAFVRTVTGTSAGGNENPFLDMGYEPITLNEKNTLKSLRMVCSRINETNYLSEMPSSKSFTIALNLSTTDRNISPQLFLDNCSTNFASYRLDNVVKDYIRDGRVNRIYDDSHAAVYVSNIISLNKPSTSLKVLFDAYRHSSSDIRVLYSLILPDSYEVTPSFTLFPGYKNLTVDNDQDGFLDVVNTSLNDGLPDRKVIPSNDNQFYEYEFTAPDLPEFIGYVIKIVMSGTDQSKPPIIKNLRTIALA